jgi:hypothetical protein
MTEYFDMKPPENIGVVYAEMTEIVERDGLTYYQAVGRTMGCFGLGLRDAKTLIDKFVSKGEGIWETIGPESDFWSE